MTEQTQAVPGIHFHVTCKHQVKTLYVEWLRVKPSVHNPHFLS